MMNNLDEQGENLLRDKLLRHEFAADEQAWEKMDALLAARSESELAPIACWPLLRKPPSKWLAGLLLVAGLGAGWMIHMDSPTAHRYPGAEMIGQNMSPDAGTTIVPASGDNAVHKPAPDNASQPHEKALVGRNPGNFKNTIQANTRWAGGKGFPAEPALKTAEGVIKITGKANQIIAKQAPTTSKAENKPVKYLENGRSLESNPASLVPPADKNGGALAPDTLAQSDRQKSSLFNRLPTQNALLANSLEKPNGTVPWPASPFQRRIQLGLAAGGQLARTPHNLNHKLWAAPTFGVSARMSLNDHWSVQTDLMYRNVEYGLRASFSQSALDASGLFEAWRYVTDATNLEFYEMALLVKRSLGNGKVNLFSGLRPALVVATSTHSGAGGTGSGSNFFTPSQAAFDPPIQEGLRHFDLALTLGAEIRLSPRWWLDVRVNQGLLDLTHDDFFHRKINDLSSDAQLTLHYYLFSF